MSIDTLLEAARYLEWQAQQQQLKHGELNGGLVCVGVNVHDYR